MAILKLAQFQFSLNKSEKSDLPLGQLAPVSPLALFERVGEIGKSHETLKFGPLFNSLKHIGLRLNV
jgi:hypothetical protein